MSAVLCGRVTLSLAPRFSVHLPVASAAARKGQEEGPASLAGLATPPLRLVDVVDEAVSSVVQDPFPVHATPSCALNGRCQAVNIAGM
jgi:hypothetical protein